MPERLGMLRAFGGWGAQVQGWVGPGLLTGPKCISVQQYLRHQFALKLAPVIKYQERSILNRKSHKAWDLGGAQGNKNTYL